MPAAAWGAWRAARSQEALDRAWFAALATLVVPSWLFFLAYGFPELGAYFVPTAPFLALLATRVPPRRSIAAIAVLAIATHTGLSLERLARFNGGGWAEEHRVRLDAIDQVRGTGGALVLVADPRAPLVEPLRPMVREVCLWSTLLQHQRRGALPTEFVDHWRPYLDVLLAPPGSWILYDRSYAGDLGRAEHHGPWLAAIERDLEERFVVTDVSSAGWPLWRVEGRAP